MGLPIRAQCEMCTDLPIWAWYLDPYGTLMGVPICASPYTCHTGLIWACYLGPTLVLYGRSHMGLTVWDPYGRDILASPYTYLTSHTGLIWDCDIGPTWVHYGRAHMCLTVWDPYGSSMGVAIWATRIHRTYGIAIWATHGSIIGVSICACPHWTHIGPIWACPYGLCRIWPSHMGPILACYLGPTWVYYGLGRMWPIWVL